ncbi:hypothetical protein [Brevifollis gellanilyticus]|uniref:Uncharacterized protein n=1 Tax=Brevifollis gellanilyticus TaxID=748831 RepID=A0A512MAF5_9BACT|nr:hypothetical protein [Brevifollis gellanilyticus]GEP43708.1 hypothetical protein BGE01nite_29990 [Brevifollis gellanilyticus]
MAKFFRDRFTDWLHERGMPPKLYQPAAMLGAPPVGWEMTVGQSTLVYRVPEETPHLLIIVLFERQTQRNGLRSPFADIVRFLSLVKKADVGITDIKGHVSATSDRPADSLENEGILAFYRRYLKVVDLFVENDILWVGGTLLTYTPPLAAEREWLENPPTA